MAARDCKAEGRDYATEVFANLCATFENALCDDLKALLVGLNDC